MPVDMQVALDPQDIANLSGVLQRLQDETGRSAEDSVVFASMKIAASARSASKIGKKNRDIVVNPEWNQARELYRWAAKQKKAGHAIPAQAESALNDLDKSGPFYIVQMRQGKPAVMLPAFERKDPRRVIENRGLGKRIWNVMYGKLGAMQSGASSANGKDFRVSKYKEKFGESAGTDAVRLVNKLTYLEDAYPGITAKAVQNGTKALVGMLDRRVSKATARANGGK